MKIEVIKNNLNKIVSSIGATAGSISWEDRMTYGLWLKQTYAFVCHSTRLISLAAANCADNATHNRFMEHAVEEKNHELLIEKDVKHLGLDIHELHEFTSTKGIYQPQYYWVEHVDARCLFGYILLLEGLAVSVGGGVYQKVREAHGEKASSFIRVHVDADEDHLPKAFQTISKYDSDILNKINNALSSTANFYKLSLQDIIANKHSNSHKLAS